MLLFVNLLSSKSDKITSSVLLTVSFQTLSTVDRKFLSNHLRVPEGHLIIPVVGFRKATFFSAELKPKVGLLEPINGLISDFEIPMYWKI